jgi:hypothetical protein
MASLLNSLAKGAAELQRPKVCGKDQVQLASTRSQGLGDWSEACRDYATIAVLLDEV